MTPTSAQPQWTNLALLRMSSYGFGMIGFVLAMDTIILPVMVGWVAPAEWKNSYLATLGFSGLVVAALMQPLVGHYSDQTRSSLGRRIPYMVWGCVFVCVGLVGLGVASNYLVLLVAWLFVQANVNIGYGPYQALIRDLVPLGRIGAASSIKILSDASGSLVLIVISSVLIGRATGSDPGDWVWLSLGVLGITLIVGTAITSLTVRARELAASFIGGLAQPLEPRPFRFMERSYDVPGLMETVQPGSSPMSQDSAGLLGKIRLALGPLHPHLARFVLSRLLIMTAITAFPTFGLFFLEDAVGLENPAQALGRMIVVVGGALAVSVYPAGWVSDRIGRKPVILTGALGAGAGAIWMLWADSASDVLLAATVMGSSIGIILSANWALANELGTRGSEGLHMGIVNLATTGGAAAAKLLGPGIDLLNHRVSEGRGYDALLITCALLFVTGALLLIPLKIVTSDAVPPAQSPEPAG